MKRGVAVVLIAALLVFVGFNGSAMPQVEGADSSKTLLIPLYSYPNCDWNKLISLKSLYHSVNIIVIANVNNGPGSQKDDTYASNIANLKNAGIKVIGYVWTDYGSRSTADVENDIDSWISWYNVDGIFFDEVSTSSTDEDYYRTLVNYLKNKSASYLAVGNPGTYSDSTVSDYTGIFDVLVVHDGSGYPTLWPTGVDPSKLGALVYGVPEFDETSFTDLISKAYCVYVTDDTGANPWDQLSSYIADEAAVLTGVQKTNYVLRVQSKDTTGHSIAEHYSSFNLADGTYNLTYSAFIKTWNSTGSGVYPMYVTFNDSSGSEVPAYFLYGNGYNGIALYACYGSDCIDTDYDPTVGWLNLSIGATQTEMKFYVNGVNVKSVTGLSLDSVLRTDAGSWDNTAMYTMYIDNVTEIKGGNFVKENFDCNHDCYFTTHAGDVDVVDGSTVSVPFFNSLPWVMLILSFLIVIMREQKTI